MKKYYLSAVIFCFVLLFSCTNEDNLDGRQINDVDQQQQQEEEESRKGKVAAKALNSDEILQLDKDINSVLISDEAAKKRRVHKGLIAN